MHTRALKLIGPFSQILSFEHTPLHGPLNAGQLGIIPDGAVVLHDGRIETVGSMKTLTREFPTAAHERVEGEKVLLPGFIDAHTHILFAGSRSKDYSLRLEGKSYLEIAKTGGGIMNTVQATRAAEKSQLAQALHLRLGHMLQSGITTAEVKTGYGLSIKDELRLLNILQEEKQKALIELVTTCLAAHIKGPDFTGSSAAYLKAIEGSLFEQMETNSLSNRVDIFVETTAFTVEEARPYLKAAKQKGWDITIHANQFTSGGVNLAIELGAVSADHLENCTDQEIKALAKSNTVATVLPGASLGLGIDFAPARKLLDQGAVLAIASDWNPGSAPMGDLLTEASLLGVYQGLTMSETLAGVTFRAAAALNMQDRGRIRKGMIGDMQAYDTGDYREILYHQGRLRPSIIWTKSKRYDQ